jgi:hypothetical protein
MSMRKLSSVAFRGIFVVFFLVVLFLTKVDGGGTLQQFLNEGTR